MISVSGKQWKENKVNKKIIDKVCQDYNFSNILSKLIVTRKFDEKAMLALWLVLGFVGLVTGGL